MIITNRHRWWWWQISGGWNIWCGWFRGYNFVPLLFLLKRSTGEYHRWKGGDFLERRRGWISVSLLTLTLNSQRWDQNNNWRRSCKREETCKTFLLSVDSFPPLTPPPPKTLPPLLEVTRYPSSSSSSSPSSSSFLCLHLSLCLSPYKSNVLECTFVHCTWHNSYTSKGHFFFPLYHLPHLSLPLSPWSLQVFSLKGPV